MTDFDSRITPARGDIAAAHLKGSVEAERYVEGKPHVVVRGRTALRKAPSEDSGLETELLFGQTFVVYEQGGHFCWGQASDDQCVGYVDVTALKTGEIVADHKVTALATPLLRGPDPKRPALDILPMNARVRVLGRAGPFARVEPSGFVFDSHIAPHSRHEHDWIAIAERFLGAPY